MAFINLKSNFRHTEQNKIFGDRKSFAIRDTQAMEQVSLQLIFIIFKVLDQTLIYSYRGRETPHFEDVSQLTNKIRY